MSYTWIKVSWIVSTLLFLTAGAPLPTLDGIGRLPPKGRVQDAGSVVIDRLVGAGKDAIPFLIEKLGSEHPYEPPILDFWPEMREGDVALIVLTDLFMNRANETSLPNLCWNHLLENTPDSGIPAWQVLRQYVDRNGRGALRSTWGEAWRIHEPSLAWDEKERFFRVEGRPLTSCD